MLNDLKSFFKSESSAGILLTLSALLALIFCNTSLNSIYFQIVTFPILGATFTYWVNDGLMAIFFLLVGLEIKREFLRGELAKFSQVVLPCACALGGMLVPALIYACFNLHDPQLVHGWAIPAATDIAFALGVLSLFSKRIPISLKVFLTAVAVLDDLGAILVIAIFYTASLQLKWLCLSVMSYFLLLFLNRLNKNYLWPFLLIGLALWFFVYNSGIHATIAGVLLGLSIPDSQVAGRGSLLARLESKLHSPVAYFILPVFAFLNAGLDLGGLNWSDLLHSVPLGIFWGLFLGKPLGILLAAYILVKLGKANLPLRASTAEFIGVSFLCGIGFTMSLFISGLAFESDTYVDLTRLGIISGSMLSALVGALVIKFSAKFG